MPNKILHHLCLAYLSLPSDLATLFSCFSGLRVFALAVLSVQNALSSAFPRLLLCSIRISFQMSSPTPKCLLWPIAALPPPSCVHHIHVLYCLSCIYYLKWLYSLTLEVFYTLVPPCSLACKPRENRDLIHLTAIHICNYMQHWEKNKYKYLLNEWKRKMLL